MTDANQIDDLPQDLGFVPVSDNTLLGEPAGLPATITLLNIDPLELLLRFRVDPDGRETEAIRALLDGASEDEATLEFDGSFVVFSMHNLAGADNASIHAVVTHIAETIASTDFVIDQGCQQCGDEDSARLLYADDRPVRICDQCLADAVARKHELEEQLNRPSLAATIGLPGAIAYGAVGWGLFWTVVELLLQRFRVRVIEINYFTLLVAGAMFCALGYALGRPIGRTVQRSIALRRAPVVSSLLVVFCVGVAGEMMLVTFLLLWNAGIFNLGIAANFLWAFVSGYTAFWIVCKLALLGVLWFFCAAAAAMERRTVTMET